MLGFARFLLFFLPFFKLRQGKQVAQGGEPLAAALTDPGLGVGTGSVIPAATGIDGGTVLALVAHVVGFPAVPEPAGSRGAHWFGWKALCLGICWVLGGGVLSRGESGGEHTSPTTSFKEGNRLPEKPPPPI